MSRTLLVFLFSDRADGYINAMAHTFDHMEVNAVKLVYVKGAKTGLTDVEASTVSNQIWNRLESLVTMADVYKRMNERLLDRHLMPLTYDDLKVDLDKVVRQNGGVDRCIIDLTGAAKSPSIDVFSVCLALGIKSIYAFELANKPNPTNPDGSLYHALGQNGYSYTCLADTAPVRSSRSSLLRKSSILWGVGLAALVTMAVSLLLFATVGPSSWPLQLINIAAAVVALTSPVLALIEQHKYTEK